MIQFTAKLTMLALLASVSAEAQTMTITRGGSRPVRPAPEKTSQEAFVSKRSSKRSTPHTRVAGRSRSSPVPGRRGTRIHEARC